MWNDMVERKLVVSEKSSFSDMAYRDRKKEIFVGYWSFLSWKTASSVFTHVQQEAVSLSKQHQSSFHFYKIVKQQQQLPTRGL